MIDLYVEQESFAHEIAELLRAFMPHERVNIRDGEEGPVEGPLSIGVSISNRENYTYIYSELLRHGSVIDRAEECIEDRLWQKDHLLKNRYMKNAAKRCVYNMAYRYTNRELEWGILTGIRPTKIVNELLDEGYSHGEILDILRDEYIVSMPKIQLLLETASHQRDILSKNSEDKISLYINIPFCTTKCLYCSFPSDTIGRCKGILDDYVDALIYEIGHVLGKILHRGIRVQTIYIGGGTPTSLPDALIERLLKEIKFLLNMGVEEYTVEGGRPDSLDVEKLHILKAYGVDRVSINPQTMNENTLREIGRAHLPDDIVDCFHAAKKIGFKSINMDVIVGLPGEGREDIENTMEQIYNMSPDNLTVHTLSVKRGSPLRERLTEYEFIGEDIAQEMLDICAIWAKKMGMDPYYLYRQKYILGNLENIGYAKPGKRCIYNIQMMEERQTILGFGAGGMSKVFFEPQNRIERVANVKEHVHYIGRIDEMIGRKLNILEEKFL